MAGASRLLLAAALTPALPAVLLAAEHGSGETPVIPPTVWGILVFLAVLAILWWKAFPPIRAELEKRERSIRESLEAAERARKEAEAVAVRNEEVLEKARAEARAIIEEGKADAVKVRDHIVEGARKETEDLAARAQREIALAKQTAIDDLHRQAAALSLDIASKVIRKVLSPEDHQELIAESIREYRQAGEPS